MFQSNVDLISMAVFLAVFCLTGAIGGFLLYRSYGYDRVIRNRLRDLGPETPAEPGDGAEPGVRMSFSALGGILLPTSDEKLEPFRKQMRCAGCDDPKAIYFFYGVKGLLIVAFPLLFSLLPYGLGYLSLKWGLLSSPVAAGAGILLPNLWLGYRTSNRARELRTALPDMLDMLVMCLEGGLSFQAGLQRVVNEIHEVHPTLGMELKRLVQAIELGATTGEAFQQFAERCQMAEVRDLASIVEQSEKYGASLIKTMRTHADQFRDERQMRAEEAAQRASVKILFPMLLCIFPAIFVVLLGPAAFQMASLFKH